MSTQITADSWDGRILQALRAPGGLTATQAWERWPSQGTTRFGALKHRGLVDFDGETYTLTEAGRVACPFANPLAAKLATPEVFTMPKGETKLTRGQVLAAIVAAGPAGMSRAALIDKFAHLVEANAVDNHITQLYRATPPAIFKPKHGHLVAIEFADTWAPASAQDSAKSEPQAALTATDAAQAQFAPVAGEPPQPGELTGPSSHDIHGTSLIVDHHEVADLPLASLATQVLQIGGALPKVVEDLTLDNPDTVEFAIYSSGGLDIYADDCAITLQKPVLAKLRAFLGLFAEAA